MKIMRVQQEASRLTAFSSTSTLYMGWNGTRSPRMLCAHTPSLKREGVPPGQAKPGEAGISPPASIRIPSMSFCIENRSLRAFEPWRLVGHSTSKTPSTRRISMIFIFFMSHRVVCAWHLIMGHRRYVSTSRVSTGPKIATLCYCSLAPIRTDCKILRSRDRHS